jgi:lysophospholipase L1-like esterase
VEDTLGACLAMSYARPRFGFKEGPTPMQPSRRQPPIAVKLFVSAAVTVLLFVGLELASRLLSLGGEQDKSFGQFEEQVHLLLRRGLFLRDPELFWKLAPAQGVETPIAPGGLRVNSLGLRGPEWPRSAGPGVIRIVTLGDSCTFGWSVPEAGAYPMVLEKLLRGRGLNVEVIDGGVPGYTSLQALRLLRRDLVPLGPRVVTLCFGWNELWPARGQPDVAQAVSGWLVTLENLLDHSHFYRLLRRAYLALRTDLGETRTSETVPRVSPEQFRQVLEDLSALCRERGITLVLVTQPARKSPHAGCWSPRQHELLGAMHAVMQEVATREKLVLVDAAAALAALPQEPTFIDCVHPSESGHATMGLALADALEPELRRIDSRP